MGEAKEREDLRGPGVSPAELREAERSLKLMLARKFSAAWIAQNLREILAQANVEYAEWLQGNPPARKPVGWLVNCAYKRAIDHYRSQRRAPRAASLDSTFQLPDVSTPTPEQLALDADRQRRIQAAMEHLPPKERDLLAMVYFEEMSVREAGRKLGWQKSAADRHHRAAMEKMLELVGDRSLLSPAALGVAAWIASRDGGAGAWRASVDAVTERAREAVAWTIDGATITAHRAGELARRLGPFGETGNAAAMGGAGRAAGICAGGAAVVVCGLLATGVVGPETGRLDRGRPAQERPPAVRPARSGVAREAIPRTPSPAREQSRPNDPSGASRATGSNSQAQPSEGERQLTPQASTRETVDEFGIEPGPSEGGETAPTSGNAQRTAPSPPSQSAPDKAASTEFGL